MKVVSSLGVVVTSVVGFVVLAAASMSTYPGGTSWNPSAPGHDFWRNYLCDLARGIALNGTPNPIGSALARAAMLVLAVGLLPLFWILPRAFPSRRALGFAVRALGTIAVLAVPGVVFLSGDRFGALHGIAVIVAGVPGLAASLLGVVGLVRDEPGPKPAAIVGIVTFAVAFADFALYLPQVLHTAPGPVLVAILERIASFLILVWMCVVVVREHRKKRSGCGSFPPIPVRAGRG